MDELKVFSNPQFGEIRTLTEDGVTLFCGTDVAKALGYKNPHKALSDHCRWVTKREVPHPQSRSKKVTMNFIPEGDIYRLAAKSELPGAEAFERWIFDEVLPSIRLTGSYTVRSLENDLEVHTVKFLGADILAARDMDGQIWVGIASVCRGLGLNKGQTDKQSRALSEDLNLSPGVRLMQAFPAKNPGSAVRMLKLEYAPVWLAKISLTPATKRDHPEIEGRLAEYQLKLRDAVAAALLDTGKIPIMQALVKMEQRQKAQDYAMQNLAYRLALLERPIPFAPPGFEPDQSVYRPPADYLWQTRCRGILFRVSRKAKKKQAELEREMCLEAAKRAGVHLDPVRGTMAEVAGNAALRDAFIRLANELAELYGV